MSYNWKLLGWVFVGSFSLWDHCSVLPASQSALCSNSPLCIHCVLNSPHSSLRKRLLGHMTYSSIVPFRTDVPHKNINKTAPNLPPCLQSFSPLTVCLHSAPKGTLLKTTSLLRLSSQGLHMAVGWQPSSLPWHTGQPFMTWLLPTSLATSSASRRLTIFSSKTLNRFPCSFIPLSLCSRYSFCLTCLYILLCLVTQMAPPL